MLVVVLNVFVAQKSKLVLSLISSFCAHVAPAVVIIVLIVFIELI